MKDKDGRELQVGDLFIYSGPNVELREAAGLYRVTRLGAAPDHVIGEPIRALTAELQEVRQKLAACADENGALRDERTQLLAENAELRRKLERVRR